MKDFEKIPDNLIKIETKTVTIKDTAAYYGSGMAEVFGTPAMIAFMENTAQFSIHTFLPEGFITVGIEINAKHLRATKVGDDVKCESKLLHVDGKRFVFEITCFDQRGIIGTASHSRVAVNLESFMSKL